MLPLKYKVVELICGFLLLSLSLTSADPNRKRTVADPVSNFFSELGDLFLDVDRAIAVQSAPKVQFEDRVASQIFRPTNEYLNRLQRNYRTIQTRIGKLIGDTLRPRSALSGRELPISSPSNSDPQEIGEISTSSTLDGTRRQTTPSAETENQFSSTTEPSSLTISENECSEGPLSDPFLEHLRKERCSRKERLVLEEQIRKAMEKVMQDTRRASELLIPLSSKALSQLSNDLVRRMGDIESDESSPEGRVIGDVMYSESQYDKRLREFLKKHGRWLLDNPLLSRWRQSSEDEKDSTDATTEYFYTEETESPTPDVTISEVAQTDVPTSTEYQKILSKSGKSFEENQLQPQSSNYYTVINKEGEVVGEEIDVVLEPRSHYFEDMNAQDSDEEEPEQQETVILAFTPDGVPLKLRMGPEIDNPIKYLHKVLKSARVSLNIPVESYEDLEPVGKEVLRVGSGILMRAIYIDVSNNNELKSLLKTLMKSKTSGKTKF